MQWKAHKYQSYAKDWLIERLEQYGAGILLLDLGLGKSVIVLTCLWELLLDYFSIRRVVLIAPIRVCKDTIPREIEKWDHLKGLTYSVVVGTEKERIAALKKPAMIYIINRENTTWLVESGLWDFDCLVIDELSSFKAPNTKRFKSLKKVRGTVKYAIGMTGTPGDLLSLWSQVFIMDGGLRLGRFITGYRERYFVPDKRNATTIFSYKPKPDAEEAIYKKISDIAISMKGSDYLSLPPLVKSNVEVFMDEKEQAMYDQLKADLILPFADGDIDAQSAVGLSNKLLQMSCGQVYDENGNVKVIHRRKLEALEDIIEAANEKPILVIYTFKSDKELLINKFGAVPVDAPEDIARFNRGEIPVAIMHPASGFGLNLQESCSHLVFYGLTWSLQDYSQTCGRVFRQGQENTVTIQHIVTKGTIEEDVLAALDKKDCTQEAILAAVKARMN